MPKEETNEEFVVRVMNFGCPTGAMIQPFIIEALTFYCEKVNAAQVLMEDKESIVSMEIWKRTAKRLEGELNKKYNPTKETECSGKF